MSLSGLHVGFSGKRVEKKVDHGAKSLLQNWIRHTTNHNRLLEEAEMWQIHKRMTGRCSSSEEDEAREKSRKTLRESKIEHSFLYDDRREVNSPSGSRYGHRAHMDEESCVGMLTQRSGARDQKPSTYWQKQLLEAEENDADRWGHAGFKELYPEHFVSDESGDGRKAGQSKPLKTGNQEKDRSSKKRKKEKRKHKEKDKKRRKEKDKLLRETDHRSDNDSVIGENKAKKRTKRHRERKKKHFQATKDYANSSSTYRTKSLSRCSADSQRVSPESESSSGRPYEKSRKVSKRRRLKTKQDCDVASDSDITSDSDHEDSVWKRRRRR